MFDVIIPSCYAIAHIFESQFGMKTWRCEGVHDLARVDGVGNLKYNGYLETLVKHDTPGCRFAKIIQYGAVTLQISLCR